MDEFEANQKESERIHQNNMKVLNDKYEQQEEEKRKEREKEREQVRSDKKEMRNLDQENKDRLREYDRRMEDMNARHQNQISKLRISGASSLEVGYILMGSILFISIVNFLKAK